MEEIRNAGALEKEIIDDARKRAEKVIRGRERALSDLKTSWASRNAASLKEMEEAHAAELGALQLRHAAAIPLEKKRAFLAFAEEKLREGVHRYFAVLDKNRRDELLIRQIRVTGAILADADVCVRATGVTSDEAAALVKRALPGTKIVTPIKPGIRSDAGNAPATRARPSAAAATSATADARSAVARVQVSTPDSSIIVTASTGRLETELLLRYRERLIRALLKGNITP